jgi:hypothetical protein
MNIAMHYRRLPRGFTPEAIQNARRRYEDTDEPQAAIAADFGVHRKTLDQLARRMGWTLRKDRPPRDLPGHLRLAVESEKVVKATLEGSAPDAAGGGRGEEGAGAHAPAPSSAGIADRLERAVDKELRAVELMRAVAAPQSSAESERVARTLASLTDTLYRVRRLREPETDGTGANDFDDLPRDPDEFRLALARRIEALVPGWEDASEAESAAASSPDPAAP